MFEVLTNSSPYPELEKKFNIVNITQFMSKVIQQNYRPKFTVPIKKSIRNLIEKCWSKDPKERPSFGEIFTKLSNQNDDFILDDVDVDELNLYIEKITQITDSTEKLLSTISKLETENTQLKEEIDNLKCEIKHQKVTVGNFSNDKLQLENEQLKIEIEKLRNQIEENESKNNKRKVQNKYVKCVIVGGNDEFNQLGEKQNNKNKFGNPIINPPAQLSINISSILSYSCYNNHTVVVMNDGSLKGIGNNMNGQISCTLPKTIIKDFTDFSIKDENGSNLSAISAVCSFYSTLYMFSKSDGNGRQLVLCDEEINNGEPVFLNIDNHHPLSLFGGWMYFAVICSEGEIIFINRYSIKNSPNSKMAAVSLPGNELASSVACCDDIIFVLSTEGKVFSSPINKETKILKFSPVLELSDQKIICISGTFNHCLAVSQKGNVFGYGSNEYGQLGLCEKTKSLSSFTKISSLDICEINSAYAGYDHSLFKTCEGKILSCGYNSCGELLFDSGPSQNVYSPTETMITNGATFCIGGYGISVVFIGKNPPPNSPNIPIQEY